ncbi:glycoside hydrolase family 2 protein [Candidatus Latescibacterota bacterium]
MIIKNCFITKNIFLSLFFLLMLFSGCGQQSIEEFYSAEIPLSEHPRPDFERDLWINLNGEWEFAADSLDVGEMQYWETADSLFVDRIQVPFSWASPLSGIGKKDFHVGWYARDILIPKSGEWKDKRMYIVIGACDFTTTLWVNGQLAGEHEGGYTPFEFDITDFIAPKGLNRLVIRAEDMPVPDRLVGKQVYGEAKGIWQTVYLEGRSEQHIKYVHFSPDIDNAKVSVKVRLAKPSEEDLIFSIAFMDNIVETVAETFPAGQDSLVFDIDIPNQRLWSPEDPFLYDVNIALDNVEFELDNLYSYFGMRKVGTTKLPDSDDMYITLNNKPIYLKMALDQSYHPLGYYTFPTDEFMIDEIMRAKDIGLNGLRIHIKSEMPRKLYWADRLGLLIQADIPNIDGDPDKDAMRNWEYTAKQQIMRDYNHPSIFSWVLFNETWGLQTNNINNVDVYLPKTRTWVESLYYWAKALDPTRLIEDNSPCNEDHIVTDINSWHAYIPARKWSSFLDDIVKNTYPGSQWNYLAPFKQTDVPMMNSECGAVWGYRYGTGDIDISYEYHIMMNEMRRRQKIAGFIFTEFHDVINEWNGYYKYDRSMKEYGLEDLCPGMKLTDFHADMYLIPGKDFETVAEPGDTLSIPITASFMTDIEPSGMTVKTRLHGWNGFGEHREYSQSSFKLNSRPFSVFELNPVEIIAPDEECIAVFCSYLIDSEGQTVSRNFVPFRVVSSDSPRIITVIDSLEIAIDADSTAFETSERYIRAETPDDKTLVYRQNPSNFTNSYWTIMQKNVMDSLKVWGTGTGFFEYEFPWPNNLKPEDLSGVDFLVELSARHIQGKDISGGQISRQSISNISRMGIDPGHSPNSYPMSDSFKHSSDIEISLNDIEAWKVVLEDDPADHRGLLSWLSQKIGKLSWALDEAGSYGYLVKISFGMEALEQAAESGVLRIRLDVKESSDSSGGLAIYGEQFGRYPLDPALIFKKK